MFWLLFQTLFGRPSLIPATGSGRRLYEQVHAGACRCTMLPGELQRCSLNLLWFFLLRLLFLRTSSQRS